MNLIEVSNSWNVIFSASAHNLAIGSDHYSCVPNDIVLFFISFQNRRDNNDTVLLSILKIINIALRFIDEKVGDI